MEKLTFCNAPTTEASAALMKGTRDDHTADDCFIEMVLAVSGGLQVYTNAGRKRDNKWLLTIGIYLHCKEMAAAVDADMNKVPMVSTGWKVRTSESMIS